MTAAADPLSSPSSRSQQREAAILSAVVALVGEQGYERVTVDAIAKRARASKATIYRRWPSKAELVVDALRRHAEGGAEFELPDTGSLRGDLRAAVDGIETVITGSSDVSLLRLVDAIRDDETLRNLIREQVDNGSARAAAVITERGIARGELTDPSNGDVARVLELTFGQLLSWSLLHGGPSDTEQRDALVDGVLVPMVLGHDPPD